MNIDSPNSMHVAPNAPSVVQVEHSKLLPWIILTALLSGLSIGLALYAMDEAQEAERETKLAREDLRVLSIAVASHGINTDEHAIEKGERK